MFILTPASLLTFLLVSANAFAQLATETTETTKPSAERLAPAVTLKMQPTKFGILEDFQLVVRVANETSKPVVIRNATVCFEPDFIRARGIRGGATCVEMRCTDATMVGKQDGGEPAVDCNSRNVQIAEGQSANLRHYDRVHWKEIFDLDRYAALLAWTQRQTGISVEIEYSGADARKLKLARETSVEVSASLLLLLVGVVVGAAMLAVFSWAHARERAASSPEATTKHAFRLFTAGSCTGIIFVVLIQRMGDLDLPFKFAVNDVIGGLIVGLFSFKLGDTLYKYFFGNGQTATAPAAGAQAGAGAAAATPPAPKPAPAVEPARIAAAPVQTKPEEKKGQEPGDS